MGALRVPKAASGPPTPGRAMRLPGIRRACPPPRLSLLCSGVVALLAAPVAAPPPRGGAETRPRTEPTHPCSRSVARSVRKQLEKEILRPAARAGLESWPQSCPLDPARDLYAQHEQQKHRKRGGSSLWTCGICGKAFRSEHYLDLHLERKHMNSTPAGGVCLADYCEIFEVCHGDHRFRRRSREDQLACNSTHLAKVRQRCDDALARCFPLSDEAARKLHAQFSRQWCQVLNCTIREERRKEHYSDPMPVVVLLILIILICFIVFSIVVCCVDYSDDILQFLVDSRIASTDFVRKLVRARERTRESIGMAGTKCI
uniref:C2H2-type domain-containing protein n=1 Tax=Pyrodinium bahamense TaxID=73915 RepID=A0A7S0AAX7_9DINO